MVGPHHRLHIPHLSVRGYALSESPFRVGVFRKAVVWLPVWRPLRVTIDARTDGPPNTLTIDAPLDGATVRSLTSMSDVRVDLRLSRLGERDGRVALYCSTPVGASAGAGITLERLTLSPELTWRSIARYALPGAVAGVLFWLLAFAIAPNRRHDPFAWGERLKRGARLREGASAACAVVGLLIVWAWIKPPLQAPDEPQHMVRASSVRLGPWVDGGQTVPMDARHTSLLLWGDSPILHPLIQHPERFLTRADVAALKAHPPGRIPEGWRMQSAIASFPPLFYWYVFGAVRASEALALTPWHTLLAMRVAVVLLAGVLWGVVFVALRDCSLTRARAAQALALLVGDADVRFPWIERQPRCAECSADRVAGAPVLACDARRRGRRGDRDRNAGTAADAGDRHPGCARDHRRACRVRMAAP